MSEQTFNNESSRQGSTVETPFGSESPKLSRSSSNMTQTLIFVGVFALWFALQMWILPRFGVST